jgi:hypothetical protein
MEIPALSVLSGPAMRVNRAKRITGGYQFARPWQLEQPGIRKDGFS